MYKQIYRSSLYNSRFERQYVCLTGNLSLYIRSRTQKLSLYSRRKTSLSIPCLPLICHALCLFSTSYILPSSFFAFSFPLLPSLQSLPSNFLLLIYFSLLSLSLSLCSFLSFPTFSASSFLFSNIFPLFVLPSHHLCTSSYTLSHDWWCCWGRVRRPTDGI